VSALEFISSIAWPVTVLAIALVFRQAILRMFTGELESLEAGPLSMKWRRAAERVRRDVRSAHETEDGEDGPVLGRTSEPASILIAELAPLVEESPEAAILEASGRVESELRTLLSNPAVDPHLDLSLLGLHSLADLAHQRGLIRAETHRAIDGILVMKNLATHGPKRDLSVEQAIQYLMLVDGTLFAIRMDRARQVTTVPSRDG
jgi:hypothetical protein